MEVNILRPLKQIIYFHSTFEFSLSCLFPLWASSTFLYPEDSHLHTKFKCTMMATTYLECN